MKRTAVNSRVDGAAVKLPAPRQKGLLSLEECLQARRSCRAFDPEPLSLEYVSQLLWAAQGVTALGGLRTAPSAAAVYPVHTYLIALDLQGLRPGAYTYDPDRHELSWWKSGDLRFRLKKACCDQEEVESAAAAFILAAMTRRVKRELGERGRELALIECGHIGQNICLQAASLSLGALTYGKTDDSELRQVIDMPEGEEPVYTVLAGPRL